MKRKLIGRNAHRIRIGAVTITLGLALLAPGCSAPVVPGGGGCTEIGCGPPFAIAFQRAGAWPIGKYAVEVTVDGKSFMCVTALPLSCSDQAPCAADAPFLLGLSGCALDPSQHSLSGVDFLQGAAPTTIQVEVSHEGNLLGEGTFTPTFATSRPNGPSCEPECKGAPGVTLSLK
jgi:hypothetical protein